MHSQLDTDIKCTRIVLPSNGIVYIVIVCASVISISNSSNENSIDGRASIPASELLSSNDHLLDCGSRLQAGVDLYSTSS